MCPALIHYLSKHCPLGNECHLNRPLTEANQGENLCVQEPPSWYEDETGEGLFTGGYHLRLVEDPLRGSIGRNKRVAMLVISGPAIEQEERYRLTLLRHLSLMPYVRKALAARAARPKILTPPMLAPLFPDFCKELNTFYSLHSKQFEYYRKPPVDIEFPNGFLDELIGKTIKEWNEYIGELENRMQERHNVKDLFVTHKSSIKYLNIHPNHIEYEPHFLVRSV